MKETALLEAFEKLQQDYHALQTDYECVQQESTQMRKALEEVRAVPTRSLGGVGVPRRTSAGVGSACHQLARDRISCAGESLPLLSERDPCHLSRRDQSRIGAIWSQHEGLGGLPAKYASAAF